MARIEELLERVRSLKALYNDAASINRMLPNEILMEIFSKLRPSQWPPSPTLSVSKFGGATGGATSFPFSRSARNPRVPAPVRV